MKKWKVSEKIPTKPSEMLTFGMKTLEEYESFKEKGTPIDMFSYAVAEIVINKKSSSKFAYICEFDDQTLRKKLTSLYELAAGNVINAIDLWPRIKLKDFWVTDEYYVRYDDCKKQFKKDMHRLIDELKLAGI